MLGRGNEDKAGHKVAWKGACPLQACIFVSVIEASLNFQKEMKESEFEKELERMSKEIKVAS